MDKPTHAHNHVLEQSHARALRRLQGRFQARYLPCQHWLPPRRLRRVAPAAGGRVALRRRRGQGPAALSQPVRPEPLHGASESPPTASDRLWPLRSVRD
jgi:hypothetical protein